MESQSSALPLGYARHEAQYTTCNLWLSILRFDGQIGVVTRQWGFVGLAKADG